VIRGPLGADLKSSVVAQNVEFLRLKKGREAVL
jgi:hypothetical protein